MNKNELLDITVEECAEVVQAISKIRRFGWDGYNPSDPTMYTNRDHFLEEIGDLYCMIELVVDSFGLDKDKIQEAKVQKLEKLKKWSGYGE